MNTTQDLRPTEVLLVFGLILLLTLDYFLIQSPAPFYNSFDWDGLQYIIMAEQFRQAQVVSAEGPEIFRIGSPFVVSMLPIDNLIEAFFYWELTCAVLGMLLLYVWLRLHLKSRTLALMFTALALCTLWSPIRTIVFHRVVIEGSSFFLIMLAYFGVYFYERSNEVRWVIVVAALTAAGATVREACLLPALALVFVGNPVTVAAFHGILRPWKLVPILMQTIFAKVRLPLMLPLVCGLITLIAVRNFVDVSDDFRYLWNAAWGFSDIGPLRYLAAIFYGFGPLPLVVFFVPGFARQFLVEHQGYAVVLFMFVAMSWAALGDERYFAWVMPIIFIMIGRAMEQNLNLLRNWSALAALVIFEVMAVRALFPIVEPGHPKIQMPIYEEALAHYLPHGWHFSEMHAYTADPKTALTIVAASVLMAWILWLLARNRRADQNSVLRPVDKGAR